MKSMQRRHFVQRIGLGSAAVIAAAAASQVPASSQGRGRGSAPGPVPGHDHEHEPVNGPLALATVSFGQWPATGPEPLDRMVTPDAPVAPNGHALIPHTATIQAGGVVSYQIAGFHQIAVYAPGKTPADVNTSTLLPLPPPTPPPNLPPFVGLIDDPAGRIYRGINPGGLPQDRVEVVHFSTPGVYLVICTVNLHFAEGMYGWVRVLPA